MKKLFAIIIAVTMIFTVFAVSANAAVTYMIVYAPNGGTGSPLMVRNLTEGQEVTIAANPNYKPSQATFEFSHWNTAADDSGTSYYPGDTYVVDPADATAAKRIGLYAIWEYVPGVYVTYDKNTDDPSCTGTLHGSTSPELPKGGEYIVSGITNIISGLQYPLHKLVEWNTAADGSGDAYQPGDTIIVEDHTTLYAIWENVEQEVIFYTVTFDANGGEGEMAPETDIPANGSIMAPFCDFFYEGYNFVGWNTAADGSGTFYEEWDDVTIVEDLTLYAVWEMSDAWDYNPQEGEFGNIAVAVALSTLALGALAVVAKKKD